MDTSARDAGGPGVTELGIIPKGTGGDFRRTLELPHDVAQAAARIREATPRRIDVERVRLLGLVISLIATRHHLSDRLLEAIGER